MSSRVVLTFELLAFAQLLRPSTRPTVSAAEIGRWPRLGTSTGRSLRPPIARRAFVAPEEASRAAKLANSKVWVKVKGGEQPIKIPIEDGQDIADLLEKVHEKVGGRLPTGVTVDRLTLYEFEVDAKAADAQPVKPSMTISSILGGQDDDNPLYVHYREPAAGAGASGIGMQGMSPRETVEDGIKKGTYKLPEVPELSRDLIQRKIAIQTMTDYIKASVDGKGLATDNRFPLLGLSGMPGIGKTSMLLHGLHRTVPELAKQKMKVKASYVTFNGQGNAVDHFNDSLRHQGKHSNLALAFGHVLLRLCGVSPELAHEVLSFGDSLLLYRQLLKIAEDAPLVLFVDEVGVLGDDKAEAVLQRLMAEMDGKGGKLVFVFTHISQAFLDKQVTGSGRRVIPLELTALPVDTWEKAINEVTREQVMQAAKDNAGLHQLFLSCCGHPRSIFDGLPQALRDLPHLLQGAENDLIRARQTIIDVSKFRNFNGPKMEARIKSWFNFLGDEAVGDLKRDGLLLALECGEQKTQFFLSLVLQWWAQSSTSPMQHHLHHAYANDAVLGNDTEKKMEAVMYNYEAVLRIAVQDKQFSLKEFYKSEHIAPRFHNRLVKAPVPGGQYLVEFIENFTDIDRVVELLKSGRIVVSKDHSEIGIEYLAPFHEANSCDLIVACVQCKFVSKHTTSWKDIKEKMLTAMGPLRDKDIKCFPVVYTTSDQKRLAESTFEDGVYFIESDMFEFTRKLGILRLHTQKLGQRMGKTHPWLNRAATGDVASEHAS